MGPGLSLLGGHRGFLCGPERRRVYQPRTAHRLGRDRLFRADLLVDLGSVYASDFSFVELQVGRDSHLLRETISGLAARLDPGRFPRIRHSTIVNIERVKELRPLFRGEYLERIANQCTAY